MRLRAGCWIWVLALAACRVDAGPPRVAASKAPLAASAVPSPHASAKATGPAMLLKPADRAATTLQGAIAVEAGYIVAQGGGNIVAQGGGNILAAGKLITNDGGSLITNDGGSLITNDDGSIVAQLGGNIVAQGGGNVAAGAGLIATDGVTIVAQGGGNIVAQGGGNTVAQGGGNIVAQGGGNYHLAAAASTALLPAAGMAVGAYSITQGQYVPVGVDAKGAPVYTVYSNLQGGYELYVPADAGSVMVVANVPGARDHRMAFNLINGAGDRLDEDTAMVTKLLRQLMFRRFQVYLSQGAAAAPVQLNNDAEKAFVALTGTFIPDLQAAGAKLSGRPQADLERIAQRAADLVLPDGKVLKDAAAGPMQTITAVVRQVREGAPAYLTDPRLAKLLLEAEAATKEMGVVNHITVPFDFALPAFRKPADLTDFMVRGLYGPNYNPLSLLKDRLLVELGFTAQQHTELAAAEQGLLLVVGNGIAGDPELRRRVKLALENP
ncbi:MAG: hypothetical protein JWM80_4294 [Cyanobacteria bacterium RYN_339]|nr:hypothetical protein [Cyanobacteria bacterium RYN_339]